MHAICRRKPRNLAVVRCAPLDEGVRVGVEVQQRGVVVTLVRQVRLCHVELQPGAVRHLERLEPVQQRVRLRP